MDREKKIYPLRPVDYELYELIGEGGSAFVHRALCKKFGEIVAIKITDCEKTKTDLSNISLEAKTMLLVDHPNILKAHCTFVDGHYLWVVMPYMAGGSCLDIMKYGFPKGIPEECIIATILREALQGLAYLHQHGQIHRDVKAGNILLDANGHVKLGDFGVSACLLIQEIGIDQGIRLLAHHAGISVVITLWYFRYSLRLVNVVKIDLARIYLRMAPEVMNPECGYDYKADIWSFGITALELAHGHAPFCSQPPMKVLLMTIQNAPPMLDNKSDEKFTRAFKHMIATCLVKDPLKRPCATKLLKQPFFKQFKSPDYISRKLLRGLPSLGDRFQALKKKDQGFLSLKNIHELEKEKRSKSEYHRGISSWDFDIDQLKLEAADTPENEDDVPGKTVEGCSNCYPETTSSGECSPQDKRLAKMSSSKDGSLPEIDLQRKYGSNASPDSSARIDRTSTNPFSAESMISGPGDQHIQQNGASSYATGIGNHPVINDSRPGEQNQEHILTNDRQNADVNKTTEEKLQAPAVQQKGRFTVTSESLGG